MNCPRCKKPLTTETIKDVKFSVEVDKCDSCGGLWFDKGELTRLAKIIEPTTIEIRKIPNKETQLKALSCPSCSNMQLMLKADHPRDSKVIIDYCPKCHAIWLDKGELTAIQKEKLLKNAKM